MTLIAVPSDRPASPALPADARLRLAAVAVLVVAVALWHLTRPLTTDVSWLLSVSDRVLKGAVLYRDILEANPPASMLLYLPAVWLEQRIGLAAEATVVIATVALALASLAVSRRILRAGGIAADDGVVPVGEALLLVLPADVFAQREHVALMLLLPMVALIAARCGGSAARVRTIAVAGIGAGVAMAVKPPLALAILLPALYACWRLRSIAAIVRAEYVVAGLVVVGYAGLVALAYPDFGGRMLPILDEVYLPFRVSYAVLLLQSGAQWLWMLLVVVLGFAGIRLARPEIAAPLLAAVGCFGSYVLQAKGWAYQAYPAFALTLVAAAAAVADRRHAAPDAVIARRVAAGFAVVAAIQGFLWFRDEPPAPDLAATAAPWAAGRTLTTIGSSIALAHPLTRSVGADFVGTLCSQWIATFSISLARVHPDDPRVPVWNAWAAADRGFLREDLARRRPDVLLVDRQSFDWLAWARQDAAIAAVLDGGYHPVGAADAVEVWVRNGLLPVAAEAR